LSSMCPYNRQLFSNFVEEEREVLRQKYFLNNFPYFISLGNFFLSPDFLLNFFKGFLLHSLLMSTFVLWLKMLREPSTYISNASAALLAVLEFTCLSAR